MTTSSNDEQAITSELDDLWGRRDEPGVAERCGELAKAGLSRNPASVGLLWRAARLHFWRADASDDPRTRESMSLAGWEEAERALELSPDCTDARYWAAASCGTYAEAIGVLVALSKGLDGRLRRNLDWVVEHAPGYERGGPLLALGRYWAQLPWPKRDRKKALANLRAALARHPENLRARLYLAEVLRAEGGAGRREALGLVEHVLGDAPGKYDAPEERLIQRRARALRGELERELR